MLDYPPLIATSSVEISLFLLKPHSTEVHDGGITFQSETWNVGSPRILRDDLVD